jgi:hypothetical protein
MPDPDVGHAPHHGAPRIGSDEFRTRLDRPRNLSAYDRVSRCRVAADDENTGGVSDFRNSVRHGAATQRGSQTGHRG